jgi:transposase
MLASPDQQISLTDPDSRSMATSGRGSGVVGYNVQVAVDTGHHLIVAHEVTNSGSDADAPSHHQSDRGVYASGTLELRLVSDEGNRLVSFWDAPLCVPKTLSELLT